jgi:hypothetical protein
LSPNPVPAFNSQGYCMDGEMSSRRLRVLCRMELPHFVDDPVGIH